MHLKEHRTSLHVLSLDPSCPVHNLQWLHYGSLLNRPTASVLSANISLLSALSIPRNLCIYFQPCILVIPLVLWGCQIPICSPSNMSAFRLAPIVSTLQLYNLEFSPSSPPNVYQPWHLPPSSQYPLFSAGLATQLAIPLAPQVRLGLPCACLQIYLLTYLLNSPKYQIPIWLCFDKVAHTLTLQCWTVPGSRWVEPL